MRGQFAMLPHLKFIFAGRFGRGIYNPWCLGRSHSIHYQALGHGWLSKSTENLL